MLFVKFSARFGVNYNVKNERDIINSDMLKSLRANDPLALTRFVKTFSPMVQSVVGAVLDDAMDVDDAVQDTFVKALSALGSYNPERATMATWLSRIAYRTALNMGRDRGRRRLVRIDNMTVEPRNEEETAGIPDDEINLLKALDLIDADDRALLHLYYFNDLTLIEISYIMNANRRTLASRLFRLRGHLSKLIQTLREK